MRYTLDEDDDWFMVLDEEGDVVAQFVDFEDSRRYADEKPGLDAEGDIS